MLLGLTYSESVLRGPQSVVCILQWQPKRSMKTDRDDITFISCIKLDTMGHWVVVHFPATGASAVVVATGPPVGETDELCLSPFSILGICLVMIYLLVGGS